MTLPPARILRAVPADAPAIAEIYAHHVLHGTATFEVVPPTATEMAARIGTVMDAGWPWLIARETGGERAGQLAGYAYAVQLGERAAYRYACETSIYLRHDRLGQGLGTALLAALVDACAACGFRQAMAKIAGTRPASVALHARAGFVEIGRMQSVGRKHGEWLDLLMMQRALGQGNTAPPAQEP